MTDKKDLLQPVDEGVRRLAKGLVRSARFAALGTIDAATGAPSVSRVALASFVSGEAGFFISALAAHTQNLMADGRCSLLVGEPGKGDPLAHPRMTMIGRATVVADGPEREAFRARYRSKNAKSKLYEDLPDFSYWKFGVEKISLNAGFGRAHALSPGDVLTALPPEPWHEIEPGVIEHMNSDHAQAVDAYARKAGAAGTGWRMAAIDPEGVDLARGDEVARLWFETPIGSARDIRPVLVALAKV